MKRKLSRILIGAILLSTTLSSTAFSYSIHGKTDEWEYRIETESNTITLIDYIATSSEAYVDIPEEIDGYPVVDLFDTFVNNRKIKGVTIPDSIEIIRGAFNGCSNLEEIDIPLSVTKIYAGSFRDCNSLEEFIIPESVELFGEGPNKGQFRNVIRGDNIKRVINNSSIDISTQTFVYFPYDNKGGYKWFLDEEGTIDIEDFLPSGETAYRIRTGYPTGYWNREPDSSSEARKAYYDCKKIYSPFGIASAGTSKNTYLHMEIANTKEDVISYMETLLPKFPDKISAKVSVYDSEKEGIAASQKFQPAEAGTSRNPNGKSGRFDLQIELYEDGERVCGLRWHCVIEPTKYSGSSSSGGSSGGGSSSGGGGSSYSSISAINSSDIIVTKPNVYSGTWENENGKWKLRKSDNSYAESQWAEISGKWYLLDNNGFMMTGWKKVNGIWYYFHDDGEMRIDWQNINGKWYYFNRDGQMLTGWQKIKGKQYFFNSSGEMLVNTTTNDGHILDASGAKIS